MKKSSKTKALIAVLSVFAISSAGAVGAACSNKTVGYIDAPETLQEELGTYVVPEYEVVDKNGMILYGYNVKLKSVKDEQGNSVKFDAGSVTVEEKGVYQFVYTANSKGVSDVTVSIDFADRTAPTVNFDATALPDFFIRGNSYRIPSYTLSGDYDRDKCWTKVFHIAEDKTETETPIESNRFKVERESGSYAIRIHVEDAVGNVNDYEYVRKVDGPEVIRENVIVYFDEQFGERQAYCLDSAYSGKFVSKTEEGAKVREGEEGAYKVTFTGAQTEHNEGYVVWKTPAILDVSNYYELEMWVYNDSGRDAVIGSTWWNDTVVKNGEWTRITWSVEKWGNNTQADNSNKLIGINDISNMNLRFLVDYSQLTPLNGSFYLSSVRGVPKTPSAITAGEHVNLERESDFYGIGNTVRLTADEVSGKVFDCFLVDGVPLAGDSFVVTKTAHSVTAKYVDELNAGTMTWGEWIDKSPETVPNPGWNNGNNLTIDYACKANKWAMTLDVVGGYAKHQNVNQLFNLTFAFDGTVTLELQINEAASTPNLLKWYYDGKNYGVKETELSADIVNKFKNASEDAPVKVTGIRNGDVFIVIVDGEVLARVELAGKNVGTLFGVGYRREGDTVAPVAYKNVKFVINEKMDAYYATLQTALTKQHCTTDKESYKLGEIVQLTHADAPAGKVFAYYLVDGVQIDGNRFTVTKSAHSVEAVYMTPSVLNLADGIATEDGQTGSITVAQGAHIKLVYTSMSPADKYFAGFKVDGVAIGGDTITPSGATHEITVNYLDRVANDNSKLSDISKAGEEDGLVYHPTQNGWKPKSIEYVTTKGYDGEDKTVDAGNSLKVTLSSGGEQAFGLNNGVSKAELDAYKELYYYAYTEASGIWLGGWWCRDTQLVPGKWTKVKFSRNDNPLNVSEKGVWSEGLGGFIYRARDGYAGAEVYVTAVYGVPFPDVEVTKKADSAEYFSISQPTHGSKYKEGETVTLEATGAPAGKKFKCFAANGEEFEGNNYTLGSSVVEFSAVFTDIATLTLGDGCQTADGEIVYARGVTVTLKYTGAPEAGKLFNGFKVDGNAVAGNTFVTSAATHRIEATFINFGEEFTYVDASNAEKWEYSWSNNAYQFTGKAIGSAKNWVVKADYNVGHVADWRAFCIMVGDNASIQVRMHDDVGVEFHAMGTNLGDGAKIFSYSGDTKNIGLDIIAKFDATTAENPVEVTAVRNGDRYMLLFDGELVFDQTYDFKTTGDKFGVGTTACGGWLNKKELSNPEYMWGEERVAAFSQSKLIVEIENAENGKVVKYSGNEYTLPVLPKKVVDLFGKEYDNQITVSVKDAAGNNLAVSNGKITVPEYAGSQAITVTYSAANAQSASYKLNLQKEGTDILLQASEFGVATINANGNTVAYSTEQRYGEEAGSIKISNIVSAETGIILNKSQYSQYIEFYAYTPDSGAINMGAWWCCNHTLAANKWTRVVLNTKAIGYDKHGDEIVLRIFGENAQGKTIYISSIRSFDVEKSDGNRITDLSYSKIVTNIGDMEYVTDMKCTTADADRPVSEAGSLKVTAGGSDCGLAASLNFVTDLSNYSEVYFYVYTEATSAEVGAYWCGDTALTAGQWTRISLTAALPNGGPWNVDGTKIFETGLKDMVIRLNKCAVGDVFYITSLYGVPKA